MTMMLEIDRSACDARRHGGRRAYQGDGCRCEDAREAERLYRVRMRQGRQPAGKVSGLGASRRLRALAALGWRAEDIATVAGIHAVQLRVLSRHLTATIYRVSHDRVAAAYEQLSGQPGPSLSLQARARNWGWAPPLAWEDTTIDDPAAVPDFGGGGQRPVGNVRRAHPDDVVHLHRFGMHPDRIAHRLGVATGTVQELLRQQRKAAA